MMSLCIIYYIIHFEIINFWKYISKHNNVIVGRDRYDITNYRFKYNNNLIHQYNTMRIHDNNTHNTLTI